MIGERDQLLNLLAQPRSRFVEIEVSIEDAGDAVRVSSLHRLWTGQVRRFQIEWKDAKRVYPEYAQGLSLIHDLKDHYLWGLDIVQMAEFQVICQIELGRAMLGGDAGFVQTAMKRVETEIRAELLGPRWPRVYDPSVPGLMANSDPYDVSLAFAAVRHFCFSICFPCLLEFFEAHPDFLKLQQSIRAMPEVSSYFLDGIKWHSAIDQTMRLSDNIGFKRSVTAYVDDRAAEVSANIFRKWTDYGLVEGEVPSWIKYCPLPTQ